MASGISHMLISQKVLSELAESDLKNYLMGNLEFIYVGSVGPDLPYLSILDTDLFKQEKKVADLFHYTDTDQIVLRGLQKVKSSKESLEIRAAQFTFLMGYGSHVIIDGVIHPYVRDMVGDYKGNETAHRKLEMSFDVYLYELFRGAEMNYSEFHKNVLLIEDSELKAEVLSFFSLLIHDVYGSNEEFQKDAKDVTPEKIQKWISALCLSLEVAEGDFPWIYRKLLGERGVSFYNIEDIKNEESKNLFLRLPVDSEEKSLSCNFLQSDKEVDFINEVVPLCEQRVSLFWKCAFGYVFEGAEEPDFPAINLDTGRLLSRPSLNEIPYYWRNV